MGYALLVKDFINADSPKDYHILKIDNIDCYNHNTQELKDSISISIDKETTFCNRDTKNVNLDLYKNFFIYSGQNIYFYSNYDNKCFYFQNSKDAYTVISFYLFKKTCGTCMSSLSKK